MIKKPFIIIHGYNIIIVCSIKIINESDCPSVHFSRGLDTGQQPEYYVTGIVNC